MTTSQELLSGGRTSVDNILRLDIGILFFNSKFLPLYQFVLIGWKISSFLWRLWKHRLHGYLLWIILIMLGTHLVHILDVEYVGEKYCSLQRALWGIRTWGRTPAFRHVYHPYKVRATIVEADSGGIVSFWWIPWQCMWWTAGHVNDSFLVSLQRVNPCATKSNKDKYKAILVVAHILMMSVGCDCCSIWTIYLRSSDVLPQVEDDNPLNVAGAIIVAGRWLRSMAKIDHKEVILLWCMHN